MTCHWQGGKFCIIPLGLSGLRLRSNWIEVVVLTEAKALPKVSPVCDGPDTFPWLPETDLKKKIFIIQDKHVIKSN